MKKIVFGALAPKLSVQLAGLGISKFEIHHIQMDANAIVRLILRDLISESSARRARDKIVARIRAFVDVAEERRRLRAAQHQAAARPLSRRDAGRLECARSIER